MTATIIMGPRGIVVAGLRASRVETAKEDKHGAIAMQIAWARTKSIPRSMIRIGTETSKLTDHI